MNKKTHVLFTILGCLLLLSKISLSFADNTIDTQASKTPKKSIRFAAGLFVVDHKANSAELSGNVKMTINETQIDADWIKVTLHEGIKKISNVSIDEKAIDTISAKGHVKIQMNDMVANTKEALYTSSEDTFILTGENSTLSSGEDTIVCDKITINVKDQTVKAESTGKTPVEAVFYNKPE